MILFLDKDGLRNFGLAERILNEVDKLAFGLLLLVLGANDKVALGNFFLLGRFDVLLFFLLKKKYI